MRADNQGEGGILALLAFIIDRRKMAEGSDEEFAPPDTIEALVEASGGFKRSTTLCRPKCKKRF